MSLVPKGRGQSGECLSRSTLHITVIVWPSIMFSKSTAGPVHDEVRVNLKKIYIASANILNDTAVHTGDSLLCVTSANQFSQSLLSITSLN